MDRVVEPELMDEPEQAVAYAMADFDQPHTRFIELFQQTFPHWPSTGTAIDLGCGPGDIAIRFARAYPNCGVHGVDGARAMLEAGERLLAQAADVRERVRLCHGMLPNAEMPLPHYDAVISNSLLHHLHDPGQLWEAVRGFAAPSAPVFVMDLRRPDSVEEAAALQQRYAANEPAVLQRDFFNSLLAAFTPAEVQVQLANAGLGELQVEAIGDRHLIICGTFALSE